LSVSGIEDIQFKPAQSNSLIKGAGYLTLIISLLVTYPLYKSDRLQLKSLQTKDALLAVKAAKLYPESSLRYSRIGVELLKSGLLEQALEVGRSAVKFNPNSIQAWALVLANTSAPIEERKQARQEILRLDPFNTEIQNIVL
jgi:tetratricopeptide (TPR) repeat protein